MILQIALWLDFNVPRYATVRVRLSCATKTRTGNWGPDRYQILHFDGNKPRGGVSPMIRGALRGVIFCLVIAGVSGISQAQSFVLDLPRPSQRRRLPNVSASPT